jgi:hypothetical protein
MGLIDAITKRKRKAPVEIAKEEPFTAADYCWHIRDEAFHFEQQKQDLYEYHEQRTVRLFRKAVEAGLIDERGAWLVEKPEGCIRWD